VVGVEVGHQHERQCVDAEPVEAAVHRPDVRAGVHEHRGTGSDGQDERVALPHVAPDGHGAGRRPAANRLPRRPSDEDEADDGIAIHLLVRSAHPERPGCAAKGAAKIAAA